MTISQKKRATLIGPSGENVTSDIFLTKKQERMRKCDKTQTNTEPKEMWRMATIIEPPFKKKSKK